MLGISLAKSKHVFKFNYWQLCKQNEAV